MAVDWSEAQKVWAGALRSMPNTVQEGNGNILGVLQIGSGQHTTYHQIGDGNADIVVQFGWD